MVKFITTYLITKTEYVDYVIEKHLLHGHLSELLLYVCIYKYLYGIYTKEI